MLGRAQDVQEQILDTLGEEVARVALVTGDSGVFEVRVDDEVVFDKEDDEFDQDAIVESVKSRVGSAA